MLLLLIFGSQHHHTTAQIVILGCIKRDGGKRKISAGDILADKFGVIAIRADQDGCVFFIHAQGPNLEGFSGNLLVDLVRGDGVHQPKSFGLFGEELRAVGKQEFRAAQPWVAQIGIRFGAGEMRQIGGRFC